MIKNQDAVAWNCPWKAEYHVACEGISMPGMEKPHLHAAAEEESTARAKGQAVGNISKTKDLLLLSFI